MILTYFSMKCGQIRHNWVEFLRQMQKDTSYLRFGVWYLAFSVFEMDRWWLTYWPHNRAQSGSDKCHMGLSCRLFPVFVAPFAKSDAYLVGYGHWCVDSRPACNLIFGFVDRQIFNKYRINCVVERWKGDFPADRRHDIARCPRSGCADRPVPGLSCSPIKRSTQFAGSR